MEEQQTPNQYRSTDPSRLTPGMNISIETGLSLGSGGSVPTWLKLVDSDYHKSNKQT